MKSFELNYPMIQFLKIIAIISFILIIRSYSFSEWRNLILVSVRTSRVNTPQCYGNSYTTVLCRQLGKPETSSRILPTPLVFIFNKAK